MKCRGLCWVDPFGEFGSLLEIGVVGCQCHGDGQKIGGDVVQVDPTVGRDTDGDKKFLAARIGAEHGVARFSR